MNESSDLKQQNINNLYYGNVKSSPAEGFKWIEKNS